MISPIPSEYPYGVADDLLWNKLEYFLEANNPEHSDMFSVVLYIVTLDTNAPESILRRIDKQHPSYLPPRLDGIRNTVSVQACLQECRRVVAAHELAQTFNIEECTLFLNLPPEVQQLFAADDGFDEIRYAGVLELQKSEVITREHVIRYLWHDVQMILEQAARQTSRIIEQTNNPQDPRRTLSPLEGVFKALVAMEQLTPDPWALQVEDCEDPGFGRSIK